MSRLKNIKKISLGICAILAIVVGYTGFGPSSDASATEIIKVDGVVVNIEGLDLHDYQDVLNYIASSDRQIKISASINADTGRVISISEKSKALPFASLTPNCNGVDACWHRYSAPSSDYGFTGQGDYNGPWDNRSTFTTSVYASITWSSDTGTYNTSLANGDFKFSSPVIGRRVVL